MLTSDDLYELAKIAPSGTTAWGEKVPLAGPGVYVISVDLPPTEIQLSQLASQVDRDRWFDTQAIVYVGRSINVGKRLSQFRRHKYGASSPHNGGQAILLLESPKTIQWASVEDYIDAEDRLIKAFFAQVGKWPYGNRTSAAQTKSAKSN